VQSTRRREDAAFELRFRTTDQVVGDAHKKMQAFEVRRAIAAAASPQYCVLCQTTHRAKFLRRSHPALRKSQTTMKVVFSMVDTDMRMFRDPLRLRCPDSRSPPVTSLRHRKDAFDAPVGH
jgi:protoheme ferro-lyase